MKLSIIIPCYNEEKRIEKSVDNIIKYINSEKLDTEFIFINDGSTDNTQHVLNKLGKKISWRYGITNTLINLEHNTGKGYALRKGIEKAKGETILLCDADLSTPITELKKLEKFIDSYDVIIGSRRQYGSRVIKPQSFLRTFLGKSYSKMSKTLLNVQINDFTCGFKLLRYKQAKEIAKRMKINRWAYDSEMLKIATIHKYPIKEVGVIWKNDKASKVNLVKDIMCSFTDLIKIIANSLLGKYD